MKKMSEPILFFGSGPVAARSLELLQEDFVVEAVITKPRPPHHRGETPVLDVCDQLGLAVHTPASKQELNTLVSQTSFSSRLGVVIDYGIIIPKAVIDAHPLGIINSHFSLLPQWRGADPITFAILSGQEQTGVSLMHIDEGMDTGPLLAQATYDITLRQTTPELTADLIELSHHALKHVLPLYAVGEIVPQPQDQVTVAESTTPTYSRKLTKADGLLDFTQPALALERQIRAFVEWPKSRTTIAGKDVVITSAEVTKTTKNAPGTISVHNKKILIECAEGALVISRLKPAGKKEMTSEAFLAGHQL
jgi:methionyl-tRNA formyltransferase